MRCLRRNVAKQLSSACMEEGQPESPKGSNRTGKSGYRDTFMTELSGTGSSRIPEARDFSHERRLHYPEYADHEQILPVLLGRSSDGAVIRLLSCHTCSFHCEKERFASRKNCKTNFGTAGMGHWPYIILFTSSITCGWNILILPNAEL